MSNLIEELTANRTISQYPSGRAMLTDAIRLNHLAAERIAQLESDKSNAEYCFRELKKINEKLEADLAEARKDQARYQFVRGMEPEDFGNLSTYCDDFDCQVDNLMKRCKQ